MKEKTCLEFFFHFVNLFQLFNFRYCLCPRGITPWTVCLYQSLVAGCIPIVLSDSFELPFQWALPWEKFSLRVPESMALQIYDYVKTIPEEETRMMFEEVIRCKMKWSLCKILNKTVVDAALFWFFEFFLMFLQHSCRSRNRKIQKTKAARHPRPF